MAEQLDRQVISDLSLVKARDCIEDQNKEAHDAFELEWTRAVTNARLSDWNDACISHRFGVRTTLWSHIRNYEEEVGYTYDALVSAVLLHYAQEYGDAAWILPTNAVMTQVQRPTLGTKRVHLGPLVDTNFTDGLRSRVCESGPWKPPKGGV